MRTSKTLALVAACGSLALGVAACGDSDDATTSGGGGAAASGGEKLSGTISGAGASSQAAAQEAWRAAFQEANPDATVSYDPVGSGGGREQFVAGGTQFAGSDAALEDDELTGAQKVCGGPDNLIEVPAYISPIAIVYNLEGVENLQLSAETAAKIFKGEITTWNDPAIKADNPDAELPGDRISVVHRSDESGTTENFTDYLSKAADGVWTAQVSGDWPTKGGEAAQGTSGVIEAVTAGKGSIGYADESQAGELGKASIKVGDAWVPPSAEGAAKTVEVSKETSDAGEHVFTYELDRTTTAAGAYPITLVSYLIGCTQYKDAAQASLVKGYFNYVISADGQAKGQEAAGSAPLSDALRSKFQPAVDAIGGSSSGGSTTTTG
ncbi:MAG: phosphate transport system substrate-binding protein [Solirubrobacteraceae bacterium]|nr:phosphate transport system substrate-binding protein [Solirubrobacteraceae bacterium]